MNFEAYMSIFYRWLDEQRTEMKEMRREHEERMRKLEETDLILAETDRKLSEQTARITETQGMLVQLLHAMDDKLDNHGNRLSAAGL